MRPKEQINGGESNAKMHLTHPRRFCFAAKHRNFRLLCSRKPQIPRYKKAYPLLWTVEFSLRFGHARVLTPHRGVIHFAHVASLRRSLQDMGCSFFFASAGRVLVAPDGNRQYLSLETTDTPSHNKICSGKFLKGVGKLLSRSFLTKTASPCCSRHSTADFSLQEGGAKKNLSKRNADQGISRSAERANGYSPLTSQAFEKA